MSRPSTWCGTRGLARDVLIEPIGIRPALANAVPSSMDLRVLDLRVMDIRSMNSRALDHAGRHAGGRGSNGVRMVSAHLTPESLKGYGWSGRICPQWVTTRPWRVAFHSIERKTGLGTRDAVSRAMTKKDYLAIAHAINDGALINCATAADAQMNRRTRHTIAHRLADMMAQDNSRFNHERFLEACGIPLEDQ